MVSVNNLTKRKFPKLNFQEITEKTLGRRYELSIAFIGSGRSKRLNKTYRGKDKPTNVLAFPLSDKEGEIFLDLQKIQREHKQFGHTYDFHICYLLIHALLHLKGYDHGSKMESEENRLIKSFNLSFYQTKNEPSYRNRSGHRNRLNSSRRLRVQKRK